MENRERSVSLIRGNETLPEPGCHYKCVFVWHTRELKLDSRWAFRVSVSHFKWQVSLCHVCNVLTRSCRLWKRWLVQYKRQRVHYSRCAVMNTDTIWLCCRNPTLRKWSNQGLSETSVTTHNSTRYHNPEERNLNVIVTSVRFSSVVKKGAKLPLSDPRRRMGEWSYSSTHSQPTWRWVINFTPKLVYPPGKERSTTFQW